jgi:hypothetical protein
MTLIRIGFNKYALVQTKTRKVVVVARYLNV